jgi:hypothetical protein
MGFTEHRHAPHPVLPGQYLFVLPIFICICIETGRCEGFRVGMQPQHSSQVAQIFIAVEVASQQHQIGAIIEVNLHADDRFDARLLSQGIEMYRTIKIVTVSECKGWHLEALCHTDERLRCGSTLKE